MASKMASIGPHSAGIFADMTVDGPEIGTLVLVVDRAKNLPNRKTMGKQNPYCAARLGKEARKTETDQRGGQTPRWDQELRFTVHDSPDYYNLKVSVFSEDKRTDLIGEAWVGLNEVVVPGGGKGDLWQQLSCKGKYAGEIRMELTYYDTREKPEKVEHIVSVADELKQTYGGLTKGGVKRRPLPANPNAPSTTPVVIPERALPGRAKHGPRDFQTQIRATSLPPDGPATYSYPHSQTTLFSHGAHGSASAGTSPAPAEQPPPEQYYGEYDPNLGPELYDAHSAPAPHDFLPTLGPSKRDRGPLPTHPRFAQQLPSPHHYDLVENHGPIPLPHAHSAPAVPQAHEQQQHLVYDEQYQLRTDYPEPISNLDYQYDQVRQRRDDVPPEWERQHSTGYSYSQPFPEEELETSAPPPPPPAHNNSSPAVPYHASAHGHPYSSPGNRYGSTPSSARQQYVQNSSPLQSIERGYGQQLDTPPSHRRPTRGRSFDEYGELPYQNSYGSTPSLTPSHQGTPPSHGRTPPHGRQQAARHSVADPYSTPLRPHPLSQEVARARSPNPYAQEQPSSSPYQHDYRNSRPRAASPLPDPPHPTSQPNSRSRSSYNIQHPVRAFESSDESPLSTSQRSQQQIPRKSVSPRPSLPGGNSSNMPFSPDSFGIHNPSAPSGEVSPTRGPIVGWHGQEIDPSDHLPVDSWAPEPEKKTPSRTYGLGRDRDFGPRSAQSAPNSAGRLSRDTVVNFRTKQSEPEREPEPQSSKIRARVVGKPRAGSSPGMEPLQDHQNFNSVPNPYEQRYYSRGFREDSSSVEDGRGGRYGGGYAPSIPPKVPLQEQDPYGTDALSREIASVDIGSGRRPHQTTFVPVRSHQDRNSYY